MNKHQTSTWTMMTQFRFGVEQPEQTPSHYLTQWRPSSSQHIFATIGLNELKVLRTAHRPINGWITRQLIRTNGDAIHIWPKAIKSVWSVVYMTDWRVTTRQLAMDKDTPGMPNIPSNAVHQTGIHQGWGMNMTCLQKAFAEAFIIYFIYSAQALSLGWNRATWSRWINFLCS